MKKLVLLLSALATAGVVNAQLGIAIPAAGHIHTEDFNTLDSNTANSNVLPQGWAIKEIGTSGSANNQYRSGSGTSNAGDVYSFGEAGSADRSLGSIASNSNTPSFGVKFVNVTNEDTITRIKIDLRMEQWRVGATGPREDSMYFYYSVVADSVGDTTGANWIEVPALALYSAVNAASSSNGEALDGNAQGNFMMVNDSFDVVLNPGQHVILKWVDRNIVGSDDGLSIDDMTITFVGHSGTTNVTSATKYNTPVQVLGAAQRHQVVVGFTTKHAGSFNLQIADLTGRLVHAEQLSLSAGNQQRTVNGLNLSSGMYILRISNGTDAGVTRFVVE